MQNTEMKHAVTQHQISYKAGSFVTIRGQFSKIPPIIHYTSFSILLVTDISGPGTNLVMIPLTIPTDCESDVDL